jgi:hypothetical protein
MTEATEIITSAPIIDEAQGKARALNSELAQKRIILNADQLASLIAPRAHYECDFSGVKRGEKVAYFFTVDGVLNGRKIVGAMFAGEVALVFAANFLQAQELANQGLRATIDLLHKEYATRPFRLSPVAEGLAQDAAGRRGRPGDNLQKLPKLRALLDHIIGGKPWSW